VTSELGDHEADVVADEVGAAELVLHPATSTTRRSVKNERIWVGFGSGDRAGQPPEPWATCYVAGVAAGALPAELLEPPEPDEPPMFGQFAPLWFGRVDGAVDPPLEPPLVVGAGELDGSGLAAETTAAAPPTRSSPDSSAVATMRLMPGPAELVSTGAGAT